MEIAGAAAGSRIVKASIASFPDELNALWREMGWDLEDAVVVDGSHLVLVFFVDYELRITARVVPGKLTKFTDNEDHASYQAKFLKLATLRLYREQHQDLEGTWDPMEGRSKVASTMAEFCIRHGTRGTLHGTDHITTEATYSTLRTRASTARHGRQNAFPGTNTGSLRRASAMCRHSRSLWAPSSPGSAMPDGTHP